MKRGDLCRVRRPSSTDPKKSRVFAIVSRQVLINSRFSTVIVAPVYSAYDGLASQVSIGIDQGLKRQSSVHCDELISMPKTMLTDYVGSLSGAKIGELNQALAVALELESTAWQVERD